MDGLKKRLLARLAIVGTGLCPMLSFAMGLTDIQIDSRLNQPLRARIEILDVTADEWSRVRANLRQQTSLDNDVLHVEVLGSVTLRAIEDASHRHFIEVRSKDVITEPLFDLPVEIASPTARVIRSYTIMLDPIGSDDDPARRAVDTLPGTEQPVQAPGQTSPQAQRAPQRQEAPAGGQRHRTRRAAPATPQPRSQHEDQTPAKDLQQQELKSQLELLQQTLTKMQETISAQNAQIVSLTAKMTAVRAQPAIAQPPRASEPQESADVDEEDDAEPVTMLRTYVWMTTTGVVIIGAAITGFLLWRRRQNRGAGAKHVLSPPPASFEATQKSFEASGRLEVSAMAVAPAGREFRTASEAVAHTQQESWSMPQAAQVSVSSPLESEDESSTDDPPEFAPGVPFDVSRQSIPKPSLFDRPPIPERTVKLEALADTELVGDLYSTEKLPPLNATHEDTQQLPHEYLEELPAAYISKMPLAGDPVRSSARSEPLPRDPAVAGTTSPTTVEARAILAQDGRTLVNKEVAEILEKSLGNDPNRVDIRIKLLEIYHHEVLGNRAEFNSLISQLIADPRMLTAAQRSHIEKLQRTLTDDKPENVAEFVKKVAI